MAGVEKFIVLKKCRMGGKWDRQQDAIFKQAAMPKDEKGGGRRRIRVYLSDSNRISGPTLAEKESYYESKRRTRLLFFFEFFLPFLKEKLAYSIMLTIYVDSMCHL